MSEELSSGLKVAFAGARYPQLIGFIEDVANFGLWLKEVFRFDKADFEEVKEYISRKFEELEAKVDEEEKERIKAELEVAEDEEVRKELEERLKELKEKEKAELQKAFSDVIVKVVKKAGKYIKASKYKEIYKEVKTEDGEKEPEKSIWKIVLEDKEKKKLVLVITAKVIEPEPVSVGDRK